MSEEQVEQAAEEEQQDRVCNQCGTKLSEYNPNPTCWRHTIGHPWRGPSAKPRYD